MISFVCLKYDKNMCCLVMKNEQGQQVEIPLQRQIGMVIEAHLHKIAVTDPVILERQEE